MIDDGYGGVHGDGHGGGHDGGHDRGHDRGHDGGHKWGDNILWYYNISNAFYISLFASIDRFDLVSLNTQHSF